MAPSPQEPPASQAPPPGGWVSYDPPDIENLLALNPRTKPHANAVPSAVTKKVSVAAAAHIVS